MKRSFVLGLAALTLAGSSASPQISGMRRSSDPTWFVSGSIGTFNGQGVNDGTTNSRWDFGNRSSWQYRGSLEKAIQNSSSIGVMASYVHVPFVYEGPSVNVPAAASGTTCTSCDAHLDMETLAAMFHAGGGLGFHQVLEFAAGVTAYRNLKRDSDGAALAPSNGNMDGSFSLGYGFGFGLTQYSEVVLVEDYGIVLHESKDLPTGASNTNTVRSLRIGMRIGFGSSSPGVRRR